MKEHSFYSLFWTQFLGAFNDNLLKNTLVILITIHSAGFWGLSTEVSVALAGGLFILPFFIFSSIAGEISDKYDKSRVLQATKLLEIIIMFFSALALWNLQYQFLLITLFFMGLQSAFFGPAKFSILPQLVKNEGQLLVANAWVEAGTFAAILLGTLLGGVLSPITNGPRWIALLLVFIAIFGFLTSLRLPQAPSLSSGQIIHKNIFLTTWRQFYFSYQEKNIFYAMMAGSWFWFIGACILTLLPSFCIKYLLGNEQTITWSLLLFSVGIGIGSFLSSVVSQKKGFDGSVRLGLIVMTFSLFALSFFTTLPLTTAVVCLLYASLLLLSVASGLYIVPLNAYLQESSSRAMRSQVIAAYNISNSFFMVIAALLLMVLFSLKVSFAGLFLILAILSLVVFIYSRRRLPFLKRSSQ